ncbi:MAG: hypothetical protein JKY27_10400 [Magnetovibrio sp.]|nr:hypothetical protein [Magnetovibrio sp.]
MKRILFLIGVGLLALAFLTTAAELAARSIHVAEGVRATMLVSLGEVWRTVAPGSFLALMDNAQWPLVRHFMVIPGWLLFGVPGLSLVIICHKRTDDETVAEQENVLFLYDELAAAAKKEGYTGPADDMACSDFDEIIPAEEHYATEPISADLLVQRDYLFDSTASAPSPAPRPQNEPQQDSDKP